MNIDTQALIQEMATLFERIRDGSAQKGDLEAFVAASNHVYERALVIRYKAYEQQVYGTIPEQPQSTQMAEEVVTTEASVESGDPDEDLQVPDVSDPVHETEPETEGFDLFSMNDEEEPLFEPFATEEAPGSEETSPGTAETEDLPDFGEADKTEIVNPGPVVEHPVVEPETQPGIIAQQDSLSPEMPVETKPQPRSDAAEHPLYAKINTSDDSLASRLLSVKLETLNGAFGFNEKLQIVQELFNGSNEEFNAAITQLDNLQSKPEARAIVTQLANRNNWSDRSELTMEFVKKVERRYA